MTDPKGAQRIPSIPPEQWSEEVRSLFGMDDPADWGQVGAKYNFAHWLANHPALGTQLMRFSKALGSGSLDPWLRELVILRVAHRYDSAYEWNLHVQIGAMIGLGEAHLAAIKIGPTAELWNDAERLCLGATDALCDQHDIDDDLWAKLEQQFNRQQVMELLFLIGNYTMLAWVLKAVRMPPEDL